MYSKSPSFTKQISNLERDIQQNPFNYNAHTQLIDILAKACLIYYWKYNFPMAPPVRPIYLIS